MCSNGLNNRSKKNEVKIIMLLAFICMLLISVTFAQEIDGASAVLRNRVFSLNHATASYAKSMLDDLDIGRDINAMPSNTSLVFTADNIDDMQKAHSILKVIDCDLKYHAACVVINPKQSSVLNANAIAGIITNAQVGSFLRPPFSSDKPCIIADMHEDDFIVIAPADMIDNVVRTIRKSYEESLLAKNTKQSEVEIIPVTKNTPVKTVDEQLISASSSETITKPYLKMASTTLEQSTGPVSEPKENDLQVKITVGDKEKVTRIKDGKVVEQSEGTVNEKEYANYDDDMYADLIEELNQSADETEVTAAEEEEIPVIEIEDETQSQDDMPSWDDLIKQLTEDADSAEIERRLAEEIPVKDDFDKIELDGSAQDGSDNDEVLERHSVYMNDNVKIIKAHKEDTEQADYKPWLHGQSLRSEPEYESLQPKKEGKVTVPLSKLMEYEEEEDDGKISVDYDVAIPGTEEELNTVLDLPQEVEITDLLELIGKQLGLNYMYDPGKIRGKVMLKIHDGKVKVKDLYKLVESVLNFRGFVMTRRDMLVTIVPKNDVTSIDPVLRKDMKDIQPGDIVVGSVFELHYITPNSAINLLRNMNLGLSTQTIDETNTLIVVEYAYRMPRVAELLNMVDVEGEPKKFAFRELKHTTASSLSSKVQTLAQQLGTVQINIAQDAAPAAKTTPGRTTARRTTRTTTAAKTSGASAGADSVYLDIDDRTNRILMIGLLEDLKTVNELINSLDVPKRDPRKIFQYEIQYVEASEVVDTLNQLGVISYSSGSSRSSSTSRRTSSRNATAAKNTTAPATSDNDEILPGEEPQVVVLSSTNSLLVNATDEQHEQIAMIIGHVDRELEDAANPYVIYRLENQKPEDLAETLDQIVNATLRRTASGGKSSSDPKVQTASTSSSATSIRDMEDQIVIVPDENTFSLIVYASKKNQEQIARMIKELDKRRPQVLIDVTLVEIFKNDAFQYDLDLVSSLPDLTKTTGAISTEIGASTVSSIISAIQGSGSNYLADASSTASGTFQGFYGDKHINALLNLMETKEYGRVMAKPQILVNDNEPGTIEQQKTIYVARKSETVDTSSDDDAISTSYTFDSFPSGIDMTITPHISEGALLRLEIEMNRSQQDSPTTVTENTPPPDLTENNISTVVTVPDKSTIILGGISEISQSKDSGKVPLLGDLPIVGGLFQNTDDSDKQSKLYIFVKAYILRPDSNSNSLPELVERSDEYRKAFEDEEEQFHEHSWGKFKKSNPMPPMKLLDVK